MRFLIDLVTVMNRCQLKSDAHRSFTFAALSCMSPRFSEVGYNAQCGLCYRSKKRDYLSFAG